MSRREVAVGEHGGDGQNTMGITRPLRTSVGMRTVTYGASSVVIVAGRLLQDGESACPPVMHRPPPDPRRSVRQCVVPGQRLRAPRGRSGSVLNARDGPAEKQPRAPRHTAASLASWVCHCVGAKKVGSPAEDVHPWKLNTGWRRRRVIPARRTSSCGCQEPRSVLAAHTHSDFFAYGPR